MKIFVLGVTGLIGSHVSAALVARGHDVSGLFRSDAAQAAAERIGIQVIRGDLRAPLGWADHAAAADVVVQVAATFDADMGQVDRIAMQALQSAARVRRTRLRCVYTGGVWLYGDTRGQTVDEQSPFNPLPGFAWMAANADMLAGGGGLDLAVLHPGLVYDSQAGGMFRCFDDDIRAGRPVCIPGHPDVTWPLVHVQDLACAYVLACEDNRLRGHFNAVTEAGVPVGAIVHTLSARRIAPFRLHTASPDEMPMGDGLSRGVAFGQRVSGRRLCAAGWQPRFPDFRVALDPVNAP